MSRTYNGNCIHIGNDNVIIYINVTDITLILERRENFLFPILNFQIIIILAFFYVKSLIVTRRSVEFHETHPRLPFKAWLESRLCIRSIKIVGHMYYIRFRIRGLVATTVATNRDCECIEASCMNFARAAAYMRVHKCRPWILAHVFAIYGRRSFFGTSII